MRVNRKEPIPAPPPTPTYDLLDLTQDEAWFLHDLLGRLVARDGAGVAHDAIYRELDKALEGRHDNRFVFHDTATGLPQNSYLTIRASIA